MRIRIIRLYFNCMAEALRCSGKRHQFHFFSGLARNKRDKPRSIGKRFNVIWIELEDFGIRFDGGRWVAEIDCAGLRKQSCGAVLDAATTALPRQALPRLRSHQPTSTHGKNKYSNNYSNSLGERPRLTAWQ